MGLIGKVYGIPPQPPVEANQELFEAGPLRFGVEYRDLDPESLVETYKDNPEYLRELEERSPEGGFTDSGVTIHVFDAADGREYLRFDVFDDEPHYHYIHRADDGSDGAAAVVNQVIDFDVTAHGEMLPWVLTALRTRLPVMLRAAGGDALAARIDDATVHDVVEQLAVAAHRAAAR